MKRQRQPRVNGGSLSAPRPPRGEEAAHALNMARGAALRGPLEDGPSAAFNEGPPPPTSRRGAWRLRTSSESEEVRRR